MSHSGCIPLGSSSIKIGSGPGICPLFLKSLISSVVVRLVAALLGYEWCSARCQSSKFWVSSLWWAPRCDDTVPLCAWCLREWSDCARGGLRSMTHNVGSESIRILDQSPWNPRSAVADAAMYSASIKERVMHSWSLDLKDISTRFYRRLLPSRSGVLPFRHGNWPR